MMSRAEAIAQVSMFIDATSYPVMSTTDIGSILDSGIRFTTWAASYVYSVGDRIVPTTPNGRVYECRVAGTSGAVIPGFPTYPALQFLGFAISDGTSDPLLFWVDAGPANVEAYDTRGAARTGWMVKASRCTADIDAKEGQSDVKLNQLQDKCIRMAGQYRPLVIF